MPLMPAARPDEFREADLDRRLYRHRRGDGLFMANFRADRAADSYRPSSIPVSRISGASTWRASPPSSAWWNTSAALAKFFLMPCLFPPFEMITPGPDRPEAGLKQLRIAETEKYAHVTFFFNGGEESLFPGEERIAGAPRPRSRPMISNPKCPPTRSPDKSWWQRSRGQHLRPDRGELRQWRHGRPYRRSRSGKAGGAHHRCLAWAAARGGREAGGIPLVTADHGNAEQMEDPITHEPHTAHTPEPGALHRQRPRQCAEGGGRPACRCGADHPGADAPAPAQENDRALADPARSPRTFSGVSGLGTPS